MDKDADHISKIKKGNSMPEIYRVCNRVPTTRSALVLGILGVLNRFINSFSALGRRSPQLILLP